MYSVFAPENEPYESLNTPDNTPDTHIICYSRERHFGLLHFPKLPAILENQEIHTVSWSHKTSCAIASCDCLDPNNHASVMEHLSGNTLSDMTIKCHGRAYHANRDVLCPKSSFFDRAINGYFKESFTGIIELPADDPDILEYFLEFLYTGDYTDAVTKCGRCIDRFEELEKALKDWFYTPDDETLSDSPESDEAEGTDQPESSDERYTAKDIKDLTNWCEKDFDKNMKKYLALPKTHRGDPCVNMTLPLRLYVMAVKYDVKPLADLARGRFITAFVKYKWEYMPQVVDELYQNTLSKADRLIREAVIKALVNKMYEHKGVFFIFRPVMLRNSDFAVELLQKLSYLSFYGSRARYMRFPWSLSKYS